MQWNELSVAQKILFVAGLVCALGFFVLRGLTRMGIIENASVATDACFCVWWLSNTLQKSRVMKVLSYVMAAFAFFFFLAGVFGW